MTMNPLLELKKTGQSIWYDNLRRYIITSGELRRMIKEYGVTGVTSNPSIFEKAVSGGAEYDADIAVLAREGLSTAAMLDNLVATDIRLAADAFRPVYAETNGADGFVSVEVSPELAHYAEGTIAEARRLHAVMEKPNVMIKVPAAAEGLAAIEELIYGGIHVNVTLLFSVKRYEEVALRYISGLERRLGEGRPVAGIRGVASFFVSRVDTLCDRLLEERCHATASNDERARASALIGRLAVANAKLAYLKYKEIFEGERFTRLMEAGAAPQSLLWASTGTKNPAYSDVKYVEGLIEASTVNTMPLATMLAFLDHGRVSRTLGDGLEDAASVIDELGRLGIDYDAMTGRLEDEGIKAFSDAHDALIKCVAEKRDAARRADKTSPARRAGKATETTAGPGAEAEFSLNGHEAAIDEALKVFRKTRFSERLLSKDASLWKKAAHEKKQIKNSLGWVNAAQVMGSRVPEITSFADGVKEAGFTHAVVLGMGGSSLAPLVMADVLCRRAGYPALIVLDSTDPGAIASVEKTINLEKTLFIVASKSGTTIEPLSLFEYFYEKAFARLDKWAGGNFIAITDPGTPLEGFAKKYGMRHCFLNPADVGGRFSALTCFGLVPAAIAGADIKSLLYYASRISVEELPEVDAKANPGIMLGAALGALHRAGRNKLTFFISGELKGFGLWIEQLIAESTGKEGAGLVPITAEPPGRVKDYGGDRVFVHVRMAGDADKYARILNALEKAGHPVIRFTLKDPCELGAEFLRWETATAAAGMLLGINPFDQPDVEFAKQLTRSRLERAGKEAGLTPPGMEFRTKGIALHFGKTAFRKMTRAGLKGKGANAALKGFAALAKPGDYIGLLAYFNAFDAATDKILTRLRKDLRDGIGCAVQAGYGPRYLHSTGQLHKGGPDNGLFIILTHGVAKDTPIPDKPFGFSGLELSQAHGDAEALDSKGRRVALMHLKDSKAGTLREAAALITSAL
ncbi:MAG: bifunctional transaldolase/phosoglucose isomerase [Deltaproteobacteria bacterium]|nr:bifunctional transaldolase/phosoglucose isomerase [Deltaproteobacteria bacterium]